jgi:hypothetical protein
MDLQHYELEIFPHAPPGVLLAKRCGLTEVVRLATVARDLMLRRQTFNSDAMAGSEFGALSLSFHRIEQTAAVVTWFSRRGDGPASEQRRGDAFGGNFDAYSVLLSGLSPSADSAAMGVLRDNVECSESLHDQIARAPRPAAVHVYLNPEVRERTIICSAASALSHAFFALLGAEGATA